jgi:hypothetical protein
MDQACAAAAATSVPRGGAAAVAPPPLFLAQQAISIRRCDANSTPSIRAGFTAGVHFA